MSSRCSSEQGVSSFGNGAGCERLAARSEERLDAYVMQFPKDGPPVFVRFPVHLAESEAARGQGASVGGVSGSAGREVDVGPEAGAGGRSADVPHSGRVFRVVWCPKCDWQYGAWWPRAEVYGYWGDCPHCGSVTQVRTSYSLKPKGAEVSSEGGGVAVGAQGELGF